MDYQGFVITEKEVLTGSVSETEYSVKGSVTAFQIVEPETGHILGTYSAIELAKKAIDRNGKRWRSQL